MEQSHSRSEAELSSILNKSRKKDPDPDLQSESATTPASESSKPNMPPSPTKKKVRRASSGVDEKYVYKGKAELVDLEVVVSPSMEDGEERRFELLSPETSFAVYACKYTVGFSDFGNLADRLRSTSKRTGTRRMEHSY
jgi:hypothetical protein